MCDLGGDVDIVGAIAQEIEVAREILPRPGQPRRQHDLGKILDPFHKDDQRLPVGRAARCKADTAIAHNYSGDAVISGRRKGILPGHLAIVMRMDIDETGGNKQPSRVDLVRSTGQTFVDRRNEAIGDANVSFEDIAARTIHDSAATDYTVEIGTHHHFLKASWL